MRDGTSESSPLAALLRDKIRRHGPVPFTWFMEQALYHPEFGYYTSTRQRIGRTGDFYTNVSVGRVYGQLLASQLIEMWKLLGRPRDFSIVEEGAEDGQLALDILSAIGEGPIEAGASIPLGELRTDGDIFLEGRLKVDLGIRPEESNTDGGMLP